MVVLVRSVAVAEDVADAGERCSSAGTLRLRLAPDVPCDVPATTGRVPSTSVELEMAEDGSGKIETGLRTSALAELAPADGPITTWVGTVRPRVGVHVAWAADRETTAPPATIAMEVDATAVAGSRGITVGARTAALELAMALLASIAI